MTVEVVPATDRYQPVHYDSADWVAAMRPAVDLAKVVADTAFVPDALRGKPAAVAAAILTGRELGIGPMASLRAINVIQGRPALSAELMRGLALAAGHDLHITAATGSLCEVRARRLGAGEWQTFIYTIDDAKRAGLAGKDNWRKDPRAMLIARATSLACRAIMADLTMGIAIAEELADGAVTAAEPAAPSAHPLPETGVPHALRGTTVRRKPLPATGTPPDPPAPSETLSARPPDLDPEPAPDPDPAGPPPPHEVAERGGEAAPAGPDQPASRAQQRMMHALFNGAGVTDRPQRLEMTWNIIGRHVESSRDLTRAEAQRVIDRMNAPPDPDPPDDPDQPDPNQEPLL